LATSLDDVSVGECSGNSVEFMPAGAPVGVCIELAPAAQSV